MTYGELVTMSNEKAREQKSILIEAWHIARWCIFWIVGSQMKKPKKITYYLDIEKLTGGESEDNEEVETLTINEKIRQWERIDKAKGRSPVDYRKIMKLDK